MRIIPHGSTSIFVALTLAVGCGGGGSGKPPGGAQTMKVVGTSGGAVSSSDGKLAVEIPAGALPIDVAITTETVAAPAEGAVSTVYEIGPTGTQFAMPVTLTLHYDPTALNGAPPSSLRVATYAGSAWQLLPGAVLDMQAKTVSGVTTHLSPYAIVTRGRGQGVRVGALELELSCGADAGAPASGGGSSTDPGSDPGTAAAFCDPPRCTSAANACSQYPGATVDSCVDGPSGYTASCCFAPSAPICFAMASSYACDGSSTGGTSCPAAPTCEIGDHGLRGIPGRDPAELHEYGQRLQRRLLLRTERARLRRGRRGARVRREQRGRFHLPAGAALRRRKPLRQLRRRDRPVVHRHGRRLHRELLLRARNSPGRARG